MFTFCVALAIFLTECALTVEASGWDIQEEEDSLNKCPPNWKGAHVNYTSCHPEIGYFYMTRCKAAEPSEDVQLHGRLTRQETSLANCAFRCYNWNWNDLECKYYKDPGCAGFDWYPNTGTCVMWTEVCDDAPPACPYPTCDTVYHFNRFDCLASKDWAAFHFQKDVTQLRDCPPLEPRETVCIDGDQCACLEAPPDVLIGCAENCGVKASPDLPLRLQVCCTSCKIGEIYAYEWSINTYINWETQSDTGRRYLGLAIDDDVLQGSSQYEVSVRVQRIMPEGPCFEKPARSTYTITMASRPITGICKVGC